MKSEEPKLAKTNRTDLSDFGDDVLVKCPKCNGCAHLLRFPDRTGHRCVCPACAFTREWILANQSTMPGLGSGPKLGGFDLDLWLQTPCCGEVLWAYNREHIDFLEALIGAKLRERQPHPQYGWSNAGMVSRLPRWMLAGSKREQVLKALAILKALCTLQEEGKKR